jgi:GNAT superfamily N-acetyltransferase
MARSSSSTVGSATTVAGLSATDAREIPLDLWLRPGAAVPCDEDLPLLVGSDAGSERVVVRLDGKAVSHAALYRHTYVMPQAGDLGVGIIGAVATDPDHRRQGHARRCILNLQETARATNLDVVVLWNEHESSLYKRLGFVRAGREILHGVTRWDLPDLLGTSRVRAIESRDLPAVRELHERELASTVRTPGMWRRLLAVPRTEAWVLERDQHIDAYGVLGKGNDLQNCVHEWGGAEDALPALLAGIFARRPDLDELLVMSAPWKEEASRAMALHGLAGTPGVLGMIWLPEAPALAARLRRLEVGDRSHDDIVRALFDGVHAAPFYLRGLDSM